MKNLVILGATGSIGTSARRIARALPDRVRIVGMSAHNNTQELDRAGAEFPQARTVISSGDGGQDRLIELATLPEADLVLVSIVGTAGLRPALAAIEAGKDLAIASKEILVMAGEIVMAKAASHGIHVLPVDSEHNAIFQCLEGKDPATVRKVVLTCSGGPFRGASAQEIHSATPDQALCHPTWSMGRKISIDSATLFNKGLEMIEAKWLFGLTMDRVDVIIHPQSIIHSMVEFIDGSVLAQLSHSDMGFPIQYAVTWPERAASTLQPLDFAALSHLDFEAPRRDQFPALDLAARAGETCGTLPAALNAANEIAVAAFLEGKIAFPAIWEIVAETMDATPWQKDPTLEQILAADQEARRIASDAVLKGKAGALPSKK